jgi:hypothetical protein
MNKKRSLSSEAPVAGSISICKLFIQRLFDIDFNNIKVYNELC